jgi:hypothetical protein
MTRCASSMTYWMFSTDPHTQMPAHFETHTTERTIGITTLPSKSVHDHPIHSFTISRYVAPGFQSQLLKIGSSPHHSQSHW